MSGTNWHSFSAGQLGEATKVNEAFDWLEGHFLPQTNGGATTTVSYDVGSATYQWRSLYVGTAIKIWNTEIAGADNTSIEVNGGTFRIKAGGARGSTANSGGVEREVQAGSISTPDLRANATFNWTGDDSGNLATGTTITSVSLAPLGTKLVMLVGHVAIPGTLSSAEMQVSVCIAKGAASVSGNVARSRISQGVTTGPWTHNIRIVCWDLPNTTSISYDLRVTANTGTAAAIVDYSLAAIEMRA